MNAGMTGLAMSLAIAFALVVVRTSAFVFVSPFPGPSVPAVSRIGLALALAFAVAPAIGPSRMSTLGFDVVVASLAEAATGATIGLVFRIGLSASEVLGSTLAHALGLTLASTYDPAAGTTVDPLTRLTSVIALGMALSIGAHRVVLGAVLASFRIAPLGAFVDLGAAVPATLAWAQASIDCGMRLAVPAITVSLAVQLALGLATRSAPALQSFGVALPLTLASGLLVIAHGADDALEGLAAHLGSLAEVIGRVLSKGP